MNRSQLIRYLIGFTACFPLIFAADDKPYGLVNKVQTECEYDAMSAGSKLADNYNSFDEKTEDQHCLKSDYFSKKLAFLNYLEEGSSQQVDSINYHCLEDKWIYMIGDSKVHQIWETFLRPLQKAKLSVGEYSSTNCTPQYPNRETNTSEQNSFPDDAWEASALHESTCHRPGFGKVGKISWNWKRFPYEEHDDLIFGPEGVWSSDSEQRRPDFLILSAGMHTCVRAVGARLSTDANHDHHKHYNVSMLRQHEKDFKKLLDAVKESVQRPSSRPKTTVIVMTGGRSVSANHPGYFKEYECQWRYNRFVAHNAHRHGYPVVEAEELERRLLFKQEYLFNFSPSDEYAKDNPEVVPPVQTVVPSVLLGDPAPQIISTSLLAMISCLGSNASYVPSGGDPTKLFHNER